MQVMSESRTGGTRVVLAYRLGYSTAEHRLGDRWRRGPAISFDPRLAGVLISQHIDPEGNEVDSPATESPTALVDARPVAHDAGSRLEEESMTVAGARRTLTSPARSRTGTTVVLAVLLALLAVGAAQGGFAMAIDPYTPLGMTTAYLEQAPVDTYLWPGIFLLAIAAASLLSAIGLLTGWKWRWAVPIERAIGYRWPWIGAVSTGIVLFVFEVIEIFLIPFHPIMHPLLLAHSGAIVGLAFAEPIRRSFRHPPEA